jgi:hypothetical protein
MRSRVYLSLRLTLETLILQKLCPDVDPTDLFTSQKHKLDEAWAALGEELYNLQLTQLRDEFLKSLAL